MSLMVNVVNVFVDDGGDHGNPLGIVWASPQTKKREQDIAADLGFSETIFIDAVENGTAKARIFTPSRQLKFAGHPIVGLASWLQSTGEDLHEIDVPAGSARLRFDDDRVFVNALPQWCPEFTLYRLDAPEEVDAVDPDAYSFGANYVWAWVDKEAGTVRSRMFAPDLGIREDEATGSAAVRLTAELGRDLDITQGHGSRLYTHARYLGQQVEVGGRVSDARLMELT
ncbi:PhzF family phenazine biosynthesis protein [Microbacterium aquimaris]|uniref:PhzF family phenazine biosynthesis protein n=1 Tax=Microbacterium aquimaris TaxID=459816 RepID=A0ABU5N7G2_9MICO|nr:PhzF family phenazine biosynthesis protein [Microbacterium aquimaris]MDZ8162040.1 PhzF family phenazine biosynthesis protein [Microbacterium aquimaris]